MAILIDLNKIIANAQVKLRFRSHGLTAAAYKLDRIARDNVLQRKQNKRYAKEHRDELQHSLEDVLSHRYDLSPVVGTKCEDGDGRGSSPSGNGMPTRASAPRFREQLV